MVPFFKSAGSHEAQIGRLAGFCCRLLTIDALDPPEYQLQTALDPESFKDCDMDVTGECSGFRLG